MLNDLQELCAVGTVDITMPRRGMPGIAAPDGWLWLETPSKKLKGQTVEVWLEALIDRGYIRATYSMTSGNAARIRVYVLPADIRKGLVPEMGQNLRTMLRQLLRSLDTSEQAWAGGNVQPEATQRIAMSSGVRKTKQPNNENYYYFDARAVQFFRDPVYPELERHARYNLRHQRVRKEHRQPATS